MKPPAFQFYADDFLAGTQLLTDTETGKYIRLLCFQWSQGGVTDDDLERLGLGLGFSGFPKIRTKFQFFPEEGIWKNARLEIERSKQVQFRLKQAENGAKGGRPQKGLGYSGETQTKAKKSPPSPSPSPSPFVVERELPEANQPTLEEVLAKAQMIGIAEWKATDWFHEMEGCGWKDFNHRPIEKWVPILTRVKIKWEADGRPMGPPSSKNSPAKPRTNRSLNI